MGIWSYQAVVFLANELPFLVYTKAHLAPSALDMTLQTHTVVRDWACMAKRCPWSPRGAVPDPTWKRATIICSHAFCWIRITPTCLKIDLGRTSARLMTFAPLSQEIYANKWHDVRSYSHGIIWLMTDPRGFGGGPLKGAIEGTDSSIQTDRRTDRQTDWQWPTVPI